MGFFVFSDSGCGKLSVSVHTDHARGDGVSLIGYINGKPSTTAMPDSTGVCNASKRRSDEPATVLSEDKFRTKTSDLGRGLGTRM